MQCLKASDMGDLGRRLARLEQQMGDSCGPGWDEVTAARRRLGRHALRLLNVKFFGLSGPTVAEDEQIAQDCTLVAAWDRQHGIEPEPLGPVDRVRIARAIEARIRLGEPWPTG